MSALYDNVIASPCPTCGEIGRVRVFSEFDGVVDIAMCNACNMAWSPSGVIQFPAGSGKATT